MFRSLLGEAFRLNRGGLVGERNISMVGSCVRSLEETLARNSSFVVITPSGMLSTATRTFPCWIQPTRFGFRTLMTSAPRDGYGGGLSSTPSVVRGTVKVTWIAQ